MARTYDLVERTAKFGELTIDLAKKVKRDVITNPLISQLVRAGTSVGANMAEADEAGSDKEFAYRMTLCCRELKETKHWLRMIVRAEPAIQDDARKLWRESDELLRIIATIRRKAAGINEDSDPYELSHDVRLDIERNKFDL